MYTFMTHTRIYFLQFLPKKEKNSLLNIIAAKRIIIGGKLTISPSFLQCQLVGALGRCTHENVRREEVEPPVAFSIGPILVLKVASYVSGKSDESKTHITHHFKLGRSVVVSQKSKSKYGASKEVYIFQ